MKPLFLGKSPKSHFSTVLFIHTSDYLRYLRRKQIATVALQLTHRRLTSGGIKFTNLPRNQLLTTVFVKLLPDLSHARPPKGPSFLKGGPDPLPPAGAGAGSTAATRGCFGCLNAPEISDKHLTHKNVGLSSV